MLILALFKSSRDYEIDQDVGFTLIEAQEIDDIGVKGIVNKVRTTVGDTPTYLSIDIDGKQACLLVHVAPSNRLPFIFWDHRAER